MNSARTAFTATIAVGGEIADNRVPSADFSRNPRLRKQAVRLRMLSELQEKHWRAKEQARSTCRSRAEFRSASTYRVAFLASGRSHPAGHCAAASRHATLIGVGVNAEV